MLKKDPTTNDKLTKAIRDEPVPIAATHNEIHLERVPKDVLIVHTYFTLKFLCLF